MDIWHLRTEQDVIKLSDESMAKARKLILNNVKSEVDVEIMMKYGLFPSEDFDRNTIDRLTMDPISYKFWHPKGFYQKGHGLQTNQGFQNNTTWYYNTLEGHKRNGIEKAISIPLMYIAPELVYKRSKRPKTDMSLFRGPLSLTATKDQVSIHDIKTFMGTIDINGDTWNTIPVTRYAEGMSKGLYNEESTKEFCGTFYYNEPESLTYLTFRTYRIYFNKTDALDKLGQEFNTEYINLDFVDPTLRDHMNGVLPVNLMMTPSEYTNYKMTKSKLYRPINNNPPEIKTYVGGHLNLYALEDPLDQDLCTTAAEYGIDIVILTNMVGSNQIVTEVLDTRSRMISFSNLVYVS